MWNCALFSGSILLVGVTLSSTALAQDRHSLISCPNLWLKRNAIYREAGYCFKSQLAIRQFGNQGCRFKNIEDVPLKGRELREVSELRRWERIKGCQNGG
jgi:hypothetical protein